MNHIEERIESKVADKGLDIPEGAAGRIARFLGAVIQGGERLHLFSRRELDEKRLVDRHVADAINGLAFVRPKRGARVLDYGAGSGVIGIVWAILRPDLDVVLLESMGRKAYFMTDVIAKLGIPNIDTWEARAEDVVDAEECGFDLLISRGIATDKKSILLVRRLLRPFGEALFYKGPSTASELKAIARRTRHLTVTREEVTPLEDDKVRHFVTLCFVPVESR